MFLTYEQLRRLGRALDQLRFEGANPAAIYIIRLLALTGCRRNEIAGLTWDEVDFDHDCLRLTSSKTGKSFRPLGTAAIEILQSLKAGQAEHVGKWVFPAASGSSHFQGVKRIWSRALKLAELTGVTLHTLRHTFASHAVSNGESLPMIGAFLGHSNARSTSRYAHIAYNPMTAAVDRHSRHIDNAMRGVGITRSSIMRE
jgi:integrase